MNAVNANLFKSSEKPGKTQDRNLGQVSMSQEAFKGASSNRRLAAMQAQRDSVAATIDDSEFYRSANMVDNTKDTLVEENIRGVLEKHMASGPDHRPCKVPPQLYEKLPMMKEGIYLKDFKPQDLSLSKPHYGDANNPYENFIPKHPPALDNSLHRRDYVPKQLKNTGEPVIRDVISSQNDFAKHLRAPKPNDTLYKVPVC